MADDENQDDNGSDESSSEDNGSDEESVEGASAGARGEELSGGSVEEKEVGDRSDDQQAPSSGALPGPVNPPEGGKN
ncbi:MAG: hypothetical protein ACR2HV_02315 [Acidimicrobiales bacterium]